METKTYYMILGVSRGETPAGIRAAYRDRARRLHPDVAGGDTTRAFQELSEAYGVLSDPARRREYNARLAAEVAIGKRATTSIFSHSETIHPSFEAMYERVLRNFTGIGVPKSESVEALEIEVLLTRDEAVAGCLVPVGVPTFQRCPRCRGSGLDGMYACVRCKQAGMIDIERLVQVRVPPMVPPSSVYEVGLEGLGIHNFWLRLHVFVET